MAERAIADMQTTAAAAAPSQSAEQSADVYFSVDVETDGPIPGPYSMLSFAIVPAGRLQAGAYAPPRDYDDRFYVELKPISDEFEPAALLVNGLDRDELRVSGSEPREAMQRATEWIRSRCAGGEPVMIAYPLGFDWSWIHWYFIKYVGASPFKHSRAFDLKTAVAVTEGTTITLAGRSRLPMGLRGNHQHTHNAADDAVAQAEIFARLMEREGVRRDRR